VEEKKKTLLEMAKELDGMERAVTSDEAELLEEVLKMLKAGKRLSPAQASKIEKMDKKYLSEKEEESEDDEEDDQQQAEEEGDPDEDNFL
jgi:hypothetical protein